MDVRKELDKVEVLIKARAEYRFAELAVKLGISDGTEETFIGRLREQAQREADLAAMTPFERIGVVAREFNEAMAKMARDFERGYNYGR